jgi:hypothetical protein
MQEKAVEAKVMPRQGLNLKPLQAGNSRRGVDAEKTAY